MEATSPDGEAGRGPGGGAPAPEPDLMVPADDPRLPGLRRILAVMDQLRGEGGCPWDRAQDAGTLRPFLLEECHELLEALDRGEPALVHEELGDVLFQVVFHARFLQETGRGDLGSVAGALAEKLVRRHPHVFGGEQLPDAQAVLSAWEEHKKREGRRSVMDGVPRALPALVRAGKVQERAARVGFDWPDPAGPVAKLHEELAELEERIARGDKAGMQSELGDLAFSLVNLARHLGVSTEDGLRESAARFERRFRRMEALAAPTELKSLDLQAKDALWNRAKAEEKAR